ncbi:MAG: hypothetical protein DRP08_03350, partial [Candidatus Aenigmatarchaeota archaeon]
MKATDYLKPYGTRSIVQEYLHPDLEAERITGAELLKQYGYEPQPKGWSLFGKKALHVLTAALDILRTGEYAMGGILAGKSPITGIREKISPSEVLLKDREEERKLWSKRGILALAVDVLLDPTTYITFGTGGVMKLTTKGGMIPLTKAGRDVIQKMIAKGATEKVARRTMARLIQEGGEEVAEKYIAKSGLKFMGQVFIPAEHFEKVGKVIGKLPLAGSMHKVGNAFAKAFIPFKEIDELPARIGGKGMYTDFLYKPYVRETRVKIFRELDKIKELDEKAIKEFGEDIGEKIGYWVEKGELTGNDLIDEIIKTYQIQRKAWIEAERPYLRLMGKKIGEIDNYLRHYLGEGGRKFLQEGNNFYAALPKPLRARLKAATPRKLEGTIKEINEHFESKYGIKNFFEPDFFKAWAQRKIEHIKFINTSRFLEATKRRFGVRVDKVTSRYTPEGIRLVESSAPQLKGWLLPEPIVKHLDDTIKFLTNEETMRGFIKLYDKLLRWWKANVTGIWPAFHTRNFMGGSFNNWLAGVKFTDYITAEKILRGGDDIIKTDIGIEYTGQQILDLAERYGVRGQPGMMDVYRQIDDAMKEITASDLKKAGLKFTRLPRTAMEFVEDRLRLPLFINRLKRGYSPAEAAKDVFRFHFDYLPETGLTAFEREWMRRIIPFWTWTRNNIPLQIEMMMKQPGKYANLEKLRQSMFGEKEKVEFQTLPEWIKGMFVFPLPKSVKDELGRSLWIQLDLPLEDINKLPVS